MINTKTLYCFVFLFIAILLEALCNTFLLNYGNRNWVPVAWLASGLLIVIIPWLQPAPTNSRLFNATTIPKFVSLVFFAALVVLITIRSSHLFATNPIDKKFADMLPVIQVMCDRFIHGQPVYDPIPEIWEGVQPIYLPVLWLSYLPAALLDIDLRWMSVIYFILTCFLIVRPYRFTSVSMLSVWGLLCIIIYYLFCVNHDVILLTEEAPVIMFHVWLGYLIIRKKPVLTGIVLGLCLLSRYILVMWAPLFVLYLLLQGEKKHAYHIIISSGITVLLFMFASGAIWHLDLFIHLPDIYIESLNRPGNLIPHHKTISEGLGFAKYFAYENLDTLMKILPWLCLAAAGLVFTIGYFFKPGNSNTFLLSTLKIYMLVFFALISIPYNYLYFTCTFFSLVILSNYIQSITPLPVKK